MTDRPIIFSGPMVRALLAGNKTQTRRLATSPLRRVEVGDRLWVRESHYVERAGNLDGSGQLINYRATLPDAPNNWTPSIHMPRWASRLTLIVEAVRVEPLQSISEADTSAEGVIYENVIVGCHGATGRHVEITADRWFNPADLDDEDGFECASEAYQQLWDSLHDKEGERWIDNPDVVALTFRVERRNIDQVQP